MLINKRPAIIAGLTAWLLVSLTACVNNSTSQAIERSFAPDPKLKDNPVTFGQPAGLPKEPGLSTIAKLPPNFPPEIPLYPKAELQELKQQTPPDTPGQLTRWTTIDPSNAVESFYQKAFQSNNWQIVSRGNFDSGGSLVASRNNLQVTVSIKSPTGTSVQTPSPDRKPSGGTEFVIQYTGVTNDVISKPNATANTGDSTHTKAEELVFDDLNKAPAERKYIEDLAALGVFSSRVGTAHHFEPNKIISRRQYVRWLVAANNKIYVNSPGKQIRLASTDAQAAFQDVPQTDPEFAEIQGLAEAGLIPSPLSGDSTAVLFRPDAPLTRENLILWKIPLDTRQDLPAATIDAVKQTWGFQDAARIEPKALRAVLADFQNGEQANIRRVFGYTALFQPKKPVTRAEAAAAIWYFGTQGEGLSAKEALQIKSQQSQPAATASPTPSSSPNQ